MPQDKKEMSRGRKLLRLFLSTLYISSFTFGGGFVIVTFMKKKFVDELHWIDEQEMLDMTAIAQSSPGAIAVNAAILVGWRVAGFIGMLCRRARYGHPADGDTLGYLALLLRVRKQRICRPRPQGDAGGRCRRDTRRGLFSREKGRYGALGGAYHRDDSRFRRHILLRRECDNHHPRLRRGRHYYRMYQVRQEEAQ